MFTYNATVTRVVDGDTLDLKVDLGFKIYMDIRVRLLGIDAPETYGVKKESQEYQEGMKAKNRLVELVSGKEVVLKTYKDKKGKYGRYLAEVFLNDVSVGDLLLQEGLAKSY